MLAGLFGAALVACGAAAPAQTVDPSRIAITIYPQTPRPTETPIPEPTDVPTTTPEPRVVATQAPLKHIVQSGDTIVDLAVKYDIAADDILFANPGLKVELLQIGQEIVLPGLTDNAPQIAGTPPAVGTSYVSIEADGLRLREQPGIGATVLRKLPAYTALTVLKRSADGGWYNISVDGRSGWVFAPYVQLNGVEAASIPSAVGAPVAAGNPSNPPAKSQSPQSGPAARPTKTPFVIPDDPYVSGIGARAAQIYKDGQARGNNPRTFSIIGDSNSENPAYLKPIDWGNADLGNYEFLRDTMDWFRGSFGRTSACAYGGFNTTRALDPGEARGGCGGRSPVECELNNARPAVSLVLLGTGDQHAWQGFEARYRKIIELHIAYGVVPILQTKGDDLECRDNNAPCGYINGVIVRLAREYGVPVLDLRRALNNLPSRGMVSDGFHYNTSPNSRPASFVGGDLAYGFNMRNLTSLRALDAVRRQIIGS